MGFRFERRLHDREVETIVRAIDNHIEAAQQARQGFRVGSVGAGYRSNPAGVPAGHLTRPAKIFVRHEESPQIRAARQVVHDRAAHHARPKHHQAHISTQRHCHSRELALVLVRRRLVHRKGPVSSRA
mgnify:CR=1 FL=1